MMKHLLLFALMLCLVVPGSFAQESPQPLSLDELNAFTESLLARAIQDKLTVTRGEEGFMAEGTGYTLYLTSEDLSPDSVLTGAELQMASLHTDGLTGPRGIGVTSSLQELMSAYPNDNPELSGTMAAATLYLRGQLPGEVAMGQVIRDGQVLQLVEHSLLLPSDGGQLLMGLQYLLEMSSVTAVRYFGGGEPMSLEEAGLLTAQASALQEESGYFAYDTENPSELQREDLSIQGLDFLDLTPDAATAAFGEVVHEERVKDSNGEEIRVMQFDGVEAVFIYDAADQLLGAERVTVTLEGIEGPRGLRIGDSLQSVWRRFKHEEAELPLSSGGLYGDAVGQVPPYGRLDVSQGSSQLYYAIQHGDRPVLLSCMFIAGLMVEMSLSY